MIGLILSIVRIMHYCAFLVPQVPPHSKAALRSYQVDVLPILEGLPYCIPQRIIDNGIIIGVAAPFADPFTLRPVIWQGKSMSKIDVPGVRLHAINSAGKIVGERPAEKLGSLATTWENGTLRMDTLATVQSSATSINEQGQIVGSIEESGVDRACLWSKGNVDILPGLNNLSSSANDINAMGQIAGYYFIGKGRLHAVLWSNKQPRDLGALRFDTNSVAKRINKSGLIIGVSYGSQSRVEHGFLWKNGKMADLGTLPGLPTCSPEDINASGQCVGTCIKYLPSKQSLNRTDTDTPRVERAFLYVNGRMWDLNRMLLPGSGWILESAQGINDKGQIVGVGLHNGKRQPFLLTPL